MGRPSTAAEPITTEIYLLRKQGLHWDNIADHLTKELKREENPVSSQFCYWRFKAHAPAIAKARGEEYRHELYFPGKNKGPRRTKQAQAQAQVQMPEQNEVELKEKRKRGRPRKNQAQEVQAPGQNEEETKMGQNEVESNGKQEDGVLSMLDEDESMEEASDKSSTQEEMSTLDGESTTVNVSHTTDDDEDLTDREIAILSAVSSVGAEFWQKVAESAGPDVTAAEARAVFEQRRFRKWVEASPLWAAASGGAGWQSNG